MKRIVLGFMLTFISFLTFAQVNDIEKEVDHLIKGKKAVIGIVLYDYKNQKIFKINDSKHFPMQSVFKFPIVLKVLNEVDKGNMNLTDSILIKNKDLLSDTWSPIRDKYPNGNVRMALSDIIRFTISQSDNNGCDILLHLVGGTSVVNSYLDSLGLMKMKIEKTEAEQHKTPDAQYRNWTTPICAIQLLQLFYDRKILKQTTYNFLWQIMTETSTGSIKAEIPEKVTVAHKTGSAFFPGHSVTNDIGIMLLPNNHTILYAIFIKDSDENKEVNYKVISDIGRIIYENVAVE